MERHIQADNAFLEWMVKMSKNVVHISDAWYAAVKWADSHPNWISVEDELPKEKGAYLFHFDDGQTRVEGYFPELHLSKCVTHWMEIVPPRKEK